VHPHPPAHPHAVNSEQWIATLSDRLIWVAGKGGVGKSTCAAAIAVTLAEARRVCLVSTDPAGSLSDVLGIPVGATPSEITPSLIVRQIDAVAEFNRMRTQYRNSVNEVFESIGLESSARLDRNVVESLWDFAPPGIDEIISLIEILQDASSFDTMVIDSAPTGHFLRLLQMPEIALDWIHALLRLLVKYGAVASLDALAQDLLAFAKRLRQLKLDLSTPGVTAVFVVTLPEPMVRAETDRLSAALKTAGVPVAATILNRADAGTGSSSTRWIRAPEIATEVVGPTALRSFLAQWEIEPKP
jgi:arsenite-transporting ATPase